MEVAHCPNFEVCRLVHSTSVVSDDRKRQWYLDTYCRSTLGAWCSCTRYIAKNALSFCPDFVLPDSPLSPSEIIDQFDKLENNNL